MTQSYNRSFSQSVLLRAKGSQTNHCELTQELFFSYLKCAGFTGPRARCSGIQTCKLAHWKCDLTLKIAQHAQQKVPCQSLCSTYWGWGHHSSGEPLSRSRRWICWRTRCSEAASGRPESKAFLKFTSHWHLWAPFWFLHLSQFGTEADCVGEITKLLSTAGVKPLPWLGAWTLHFKSLQKVHWSSMKPLSMHWWCERGSQWEWHHKLAESTFDHRKIGGKSVWAEFTIGIWPRQLLKPFRCMSGTSEHKELLTEELMKAIDMKTCSRKGVWTQEAPSCCLRIFCQISKLWLSSHLKVWHVTEGERVVFVPTKHLLKANPVRPILKVVALCMKHLLHIWRLAHHHSIQASHLQLHHSPVFLQIRTFFVWWAFDLLKSS